MEKKKGKKSGKKSGKKAEEAKESTNDSAQTQKCMNDASQAAAITDTHDVSSMISSNEVDGGQSSNPSLDTQSKAEGVPSADGEGTANLKSGGESHALGGNKIANAEDGTDDEAANEEEGAEISDKTRKNRLKKLKKKQKAQSEKTAAPVAKEVPAKKLPMNATARAAFEKLQLIKAREEALRLKEEQLKREEEERERQIQEENRLAEEEKEKKRLAKSKKKEQARADNKPLSHKDKQQQEKNQMFLEYLSEAGMLPVFSKTEQKQKRPRPDRSKRKKVGEDRSIEDKEVVALDEVVVLDSVTTEADVAVEGIAESKEEVLENWEDMLDAVQQIEGLGATATKQSSESKHNLASKEASVLKKEPPVQNDKPVRVEDTRSVVMQETPNKSGAPATGSLRSPVACILGHVDTGKTKLLDKIRNTNVQTNEAGGITQQIGATFFPQYSLESQSRKVDASFQMQMPGLLVIDTPGHESFNNLRARGSSLCDIAILVVDIMHGLEPQTKESLQLLKVRKCPFVIALNKIDRLYGWKSTEWSPFRESFAKCTPSCVEEFETRLQETIVQLSEEGINCSLYWNNKDIRHDVSIVPTSALTGEGIPDLLYLLASMTQNLMTKSITLKDSLQCSILEVKNIEGLGATIDVILLNGTLHEGDTIVVCGMEGPVVTSVRALLTPQPLKELRIKGEYIHHSEITAAMGVKIAAQGLDDAVAGTSVLVAQTEDDIEALKEEVMQDMVDIFKSVDRSGCGVYVMASTLGSLEALLQFLKKSQIPVFAVNLGTVRKKDVKKASVMREKGHPELSVILAFDIKVDPEAAKDAAIYGVQIMVADIIYHLFDEFTKYYKDFHERKKREKSSEAVFPCELKILPQYVFHKIDPIVVGVRLEGGILKVGTPLVVPEKDFLYLGNVAQIEQNKKSIEKAVKGQEVSIKIVGDPHLMVGRQFDITCKIFSKVSRDSIDCLKDYFRDELSKDDWRLLIEMKKIFGI